MPKPRIQRSTKNLIEDTVLGNLVDFEKTYNRYIKSKNEEIPPDCGNPSPRVP